MKHLIVNGDDFGATSGINRGIVKAYREGILTSASIVVDGSAAEQAAQLSREHRELSVGLHVVLANLGTAGEMRTELDRQLCRFQELTGGLPTHLDSHHSVHLDPRAIPEFVAFARRHLLPLRARSPVRWISRFYGRWGGRPHLEQVGPECLAQILESDVRHGFNELSCHPGYVDSDLASSYSLERETEVQTLCDPRMRELLEQYHIRLASFWDVTEH